MNHDNNGYGQAPHSDPYAGGQTPYSDPYVGGQTTHFNNPYPGAQAGMAAQSQAQFWQSPSEIRKEVRRKQKEARKAVHRAKRSNSERPMIGIRRSTSVIAVACALILCVGSGIGGGLLATHLVDPVVPVVAGDSYTINPASDINTTEAVAKKVLNSVVGITAEGNTVDYFGRTARATGVGTGIIVHEDGYILTNSHVVWDGETTSIKVLLSDGKEVDGELLWNDDTIDLAIIKINAKGLVPTELGDSDLVQIGSYVAAIGNPLGLDFNGSITQGVVSGLNRNITAGSETKTTRMEGLIQVDAAINSGNSGGPLLNNRGEVIGVNTAKASAEGMGFAIPINTAKPIIERVIATGSFERVYMGVSASNAEEISVQYPNLKLGAVKGAFLTNVTSGSPADLAGLRMKDIITEVNGVKVFTSTDLIKTLLSYQAGDTVTVKYLRDGSEEITTVILAPQSEVYGTGGGAEAEPEAPATPGYEQPVTPDDGYDWGDWEDWFGQIPGFGR
ncbi:MAG: S1C family serine protease [Clostridiales Family XIII bacterium]|jgi:S1-C subfamily serine protease|nr:S1C family serine protease [Clostridiales Family XIII bacterium]